MWSLAYTFLLLVRIITGIRGQATYWEFRSCVNSSLPRHVWLLTTTIHLLNSRTDSQNPINNHSLLHTGLEDIICLTTAHRTHDYSNNSEISILTSCTVLKQRHFEGFSIDQYKIHRVFVVSLCGSFHNMIIYFPIAFLNRTPNLRRIVVVVVQILSFHSIQRKNYGHTSKTSDNFLSIY